MDTPAALGLEAGPTGAKGIPRSALARCELCPRMCGVNRLEGQLGFCRAGAEVEVYRHGPHHGEEPPISGRRGSGTVFFSRCTMRCVYCQNHPWSADGEGTPCDTAGLAAMFRELADQGCHNWNLVSPTPWLPQIGEALERVKRDGCRLPVVYNTSGFERADTLRLISGLVDIFLVDLRYAREESSIEGSATRGYVAAAREAVRAMWRMTGPLVQVDGIASRGTICRVLVLPGRADEAVDNLEWLSEAVGAAIPVSIMSQYVPAYRAGGMDGWNRRITEGEYARVCDRAEQLGFECGWMQDLDGQAPDGLIGYEMAPDGLS